MSCSDDKDQEELQIWFENNEKALVVIQEASQELLSRGLIVDPQIFHSAVQHQTLHALGEYNLKKKKNYSNLIVNIYD